MKLSPRNQLDITHMMACEIENADTLFEFCDAEFNSRSDVHQHFESAKGIASWARYYLLHEVQKVSNREKIYASHHMAHMIAVRISQMWFAQKNPI